MSRCPACTAFEAAERAAIADDASTAPLPDHALDGCTCDAEPTIPVTLLGPERLPLAPQRGTSLDITWSELVRWISEPVTAEDKSAAGGYVLARLRDGVRRKAHVECSLAIGLDHDAGTMSLDAVHARLRRYRHVVYTTASHAPEAPRWRAILLASRPMSPEEHAIVWERISRVVQRDAELDPACRDASRLWYCPTRRPGSEFRMLVGDGAPLDVDAILARVAARPTYRPEPVRIDDRYTSSALERECQAVASAKIGSRNVTLNRACYSLARLDIPSTEIANALLVAAKKRGTSRA